MSRVLNFLLDLFRIQPSADDRYLAGAADLYDLERRMRALEAGPRPAIGY